MSSVKPEKDGMEKLLEDVQGSFRDFLNSAVGADMGKSMLPDVYGETKPATTEKHTNWSGVVLDEDGHDTGMQVQVWNGSGSVEETEMCSDIAIALHQMSERRAAEGGEITSADIGSVIRGCLDKPMSRPTTMTDLTKLSAMFQRAVMEDITIPPANYSGSVEKFINCELLHSVVQDSDAAWIKKMHEYLKCRLAGESAISELNKSIAEDILAEHPDILDLPQDYLLPVKFHTLMKTYYPEMTDENIKDVMEIFGIRDPKATEQ